MLGRPSLGRPLDIVLPIIRIRRRCHSFRHISGNLAGLRAVTEKVGVQHSIEILKALLLVGFRRDDEAPHAVCLASIRPGFRPGQWPLKATYCRRILPTQMASHAQTTMPDVPQARLLRERRAFALRENVRHSTAELFVNTQLQSGSYRAERNKREIMDTVSLTVDDICKYLNVSNETVYKWIEQRGMPGHRVSRRWMFKQDEVDA